MKILVQSFPIRSTFTRSIKFVSYKARGSPRFQLRAGTSFFQGVTPADHELDFLRGKKIAQFWINELAKLDRPSARALIPQLNADTSLGFEPATGPAKKGTLLDFTIRQKSEHEDKVILMRSGEFYETYGIDALMLINYCGLNPMANKCKAGCPVKNVQATLDGLTSAGLSVAVFEEISDVDADRGPSAATKGKIKHRVLTQIVSPANSIYAYDLCLRPDEIEYRDNRPVVGLMSTTGGYCMCEVWMDEQKVTVHERLTAEAVRMILEQNGHVEPVYVQGSDGHSMSSEFAFLPHTEPLRGFDEKGFLNQVLRNVARRFEIPVDTFRIHADSPTNRPRPLYVSTALQIGLLHNPNVPDLIENILPPAHYAHSARFLKRWLLQPPTQELADHMRSLCQGLHDNTESLPPIRPVPVGKVVSLLQARQCNIALFRDIRLSVGGIKTMLESPTRYASILPHLMAITSSEAGGIYMTADQILTGCENVLRNIDSTIVQEADGILDQPTVDPNSRIPDEFFRRSEEEFRGKITKNIPEIAALYKNIQRRSDDLIAAVKADFPVGCEIVYDIFNSAIMLRDKPKGSSGSTSASASLSDRSQVLGVTDAQADPGSAAAINYIAPTDRKGLPISKRYTTVRVQEALARYQEAVETAPSVVTKIIQKLCTTLTQDLLTVIFASHWAVILVAVQAHAVRARQSRWSLATLNPAQSSATDSEGSSPPLPTFLAKGLSPYWLSRQTAVRNSVELSGLYLLTAPNMSGKSTLMRSIITAALLANCGLFVPADQLSVARFDNFFLRSASYDIPKEGKSAFALEMDDVRVVLRDCTQNSLVMLDELGKGTSARDGSAIAGALLEHLDRVQCSGIFATHLHEMFRLQLNLSTVTYKKMGVDIQDGNFKWTYLLEDGKCLDSMALRTAQVYGIDHHIIKRAEALLEEFDSSCSVSASETGGSTVTGSTVTGSTVTGSMEMTGPESEQVFLADANRSYSLLDVQRVIQRVSPELSSADMVHLSHNWDPPAALEGVSVVYVLKISSTNKPDCLYIGETESLTQRLSQHRRRLLADTTAAAATTSKASKSTSTSTSTSKRKRSAAASVLEDHHKANQELDVSVVAVRLRDKSAARALETKLLRAFRKEGYDIQQDGDQGHRLFSADQ